MSKAAERLRELEDEFLIPAIDGIELPQRDIEYAALLRAVADVMEEIQTPSDQKPFVWLDRIIELQEKAEQIAEGDE